MIERAGVELIINRLIRRGMASYSITPRLISIALKIKPAKYNCVLDSNVLYPHILVHYLAESRSHILRFSSFYDKRFKAYSGFLVDYNTIQNKTSGT